MGGVVGWVRWWDTGWMARRGCAVVRCTCGHPRSWRTGGGERSGGGRAGGRARWSPCSALGGRPPTPPRTSRASFPFRVFRVTRSAKFGTFGGPEPMCDVGSHLNDARTSIRRFLALFTVMRLRLAGLGSSAKVTSPPVTPHPEGRQAALATWRKPAADGRMKEARGSRR